MIADLFKSQALKWNLLCIAVLLGLTILYFGPLLGGKEIPSGDLIQVSGMAKNLEDYRATHNGEEPYWSTSMFSGMPAYTISVRY
ncbi:MAG: hypothetical protein NZ108_07900, partial [Bacteroidia bacterium]|nr:hypothetical protein [Bacteroidia bacterium]